jgi:DNA-binding HxlR family transcriptional regulator
MIPGIQKETNGTSADEKVCPLEELIKVIGGKWKVIILWHVLEGPQRFGQLRRFMPGVTQKMLTQQLRELEQDRFVTRTVFAEVPPRVEYAATELTRKLGDLLRAMHDWSRENLAACAKLRKKKRK